MEGHKCGLQELDSDISAGPKGRNLPHSHCIHFQTLNSLESSPNLHTILLLKTISGIQMFMKYFVTRHCIIRPGQRDSSIQNTGYIGLRAVSTGTQVPLLAKLSILKMLIVGFTNSAKLVWYLTPIPNFFRLRI